MKDEGGAPGRRRDTYHHGDLHRALVAEALDLARSGGTSAVALREATRRSGVSPNAAYRHFANREALLDEVGLETALMLGSAMREAADKAIDAHAEDDSCTRAIEALLAAGTAYVDFALSEPGWFDAAFSVSSNGWQATLEPVPGDEGLPTAVLSDLVRQDGLHWHFGIDYRDIRLLMMSTLHGFCILLNTGPLRTVDRDDARRRLRAILRRTISGAASPVR